MPSTATITAFYTFTPLTVIKSAEVNSNFALFRGHLIPIDPTATSSPDRSYDLGGDGHAWRTSYFQYGHLFQNSTVTTNPPVGYLSIYAKSDNKVYTRTSGGVESEIATSSSTSQSIKNTSGSYTVLNTDDWLTFTGSSATTWTMYGSTGGTKAVGFKNRGTANLRITATGSDLFDNQDGYLNLAPGSSCFVLVNGSNNFDIF